jgi:uncharacterized membrane protein (UPF0127 family)
MQTWSVALLLVLGLVGGSGCRRTPPPASETPTSESRTYHLNRAQPRLPTLKLWLGGQEVTAEVARRLPEIATGMMFRTNLAEMEGMLFVFARPYRAAFYMRNTTVPLTAAYIAPDGTILELHDLEPLNETPVTAATDQIQFVLEMPRGWFARYGVSTGAVVRTPYGGLTEVDWVTLGPRARGAARP